MVDVYLAQGNREPVASLTVEDEDGTAVDLTGTTATFTMWDIDGTLVVNAAAATIPTPANGVVEYAWAANDVDTAGDFFGRFTLTVTASGKPFSAPNDRMLRVVISETPAAA